MIVRMCEIAKGEPPLRRSAAWRVGSRRVVSERGLGVRRTTPADDPLPMTTPAPAPADVTPGLISTGSRSEDAAPLGFRDRRQGGSGDAPGVERRQFTDGRQDSDPAAAEFARAIDAYKIRHRRRFITHEELLSVLLDLGYRKTAEAVERG